MHNDETATCYRVMFASLKGVCFESTFLRGFQKASGVIGGGRVLCLHQLGIGGASMFSCNGNTSHVRRYSH